MTAQTTTTVLAEVAAMLRSILDEYGIDDIDIDRDTRFHDDLELESVDLVTLAGMLAERYGDRVNLAEFIADLGLDEIIELTVGQLVDHVTVSLAAADTDADIGAGDNNSTSPATGTGPATDITTDTEAAAHATIEVS